MEPLFEAKAPIGNNYASYSIFRLEKQKYKARLIEDDSTTYQFEPPIELVVSKKDGKWETEGLQFKDLGDTIGMEIDTFNNGYGDLLGRIGI